MSFSQTKSVYEPIPLKTLALKLYRDISSLIPVILGIDPFGNLIQLVCTNEGSDNDVNRETRYCLFR